MTKTPSPSRLNRGRSARKPSPRLRPRLEALEDRTLLTAGALDPTFGVGGLVTTDLFPNSIPTGSYAEAVQANGKIVVVGLSGQTAGAGFGVAQFNPDGSLDASFGTGGRFTIDFGGHGGSVATDVVVQADGKIVIAGYTGRDSIGNGFGVARLNTDGSLDPSFGAGGKVIFGAPGDSAYGVALQADGKIVLAGATDTNMSVAGDFVAARLNADGSLDPSFGSGGRRVIDFGSNFDAAYDVAVQPDGKILLAGYSHGLVVARLNGDGSLDASFGVGGKLSESGPPLFLEVQAVALQSDGKIVLGGGTWSATGSIEFGVARLNADGSFDASFDADGKQVLTFGLSDDRVTGVAVQPDGKIVVAGYSDPGPPGSDFVVARLNADGGLDTSFGAGGTRFIDFGASDFAAGVALQADGKIVVAGRSNDASWEVVHYAVAQLDGDGNLDTCFGSDGKVLTNGLRSANDYAFGSHSVALQADGKIVVAGESTSGGTGSDFALARYNADGGLDASFGANGRVTIDFGNPGEFASSVAVQPDGKIVVAGYSYSGTQEVLVARLNGDGSLDSTFDGDGRQSFDFGSVYNFSVYNYAYDLAVQSDGKIVLVGAAHDGTQNADFAVARLNGDGSLDATFGTGGKQTIDFGGREFANAVAVKSDGRIVVVGSFEQGAAGAAFAVARLNVNGSLDPTFDADGRRTIDFDGEADSAYGVALQPDGKVVIVGQSHDFSDSDFGVARLNADGSLDSSFDGDGKQSFTFGPGTYDYAVGVGVQIDGKIVVAGATDIGSAFGGSGFAVARLNSGGGLDSSFGTNGRVTTQVGITGDASGVAIQPDGRIVVAGESNQGGPGYDFALARYEGYGLSVAGTAGDDTISIDAGTQAGTLKVTVNGVVTDNVAVSGEVFVAGLGGNDTVTVTRSLAGGVILAGQGGIDTYNVQFGQLAGLVNIIDDGGGADTDRLFVFGTAEDETVNKATDPVTRKREVRRVAPTAEGIDALGVERCTIDAGDGDDYLRDPGEDTVLLGGPGNDTIVIDATFGTGVTVDGGAGSDTYVILAEALQGPVAIADSGATGADAVTVVGTAGNDSIVQTADGLVVNGVLVALTGAVEGLAVDGGGGGDSFAVVGTPTVPIQVSGVSDMVVTGTPGNDTITFTPVGNSGVIRAKVNGAVVAQFAPTGRLVANAGAGDDDIEVAGSIGLPAWLYGGAGNDRLKGGDGHDVLLGEGGDDLLVGGGGRDLLIGGAGADRIVGNTDDDVLIAGSTAFDGNATALAAIMGEWTSSRDYATRTANLQGTGSGGSFAARLNGAFFLRPDVTVFDDGAADTLTGSQGQDWFWANFDSGVKDKVTDLSASEFACDLDWINNGF